MKSRWQYVAFPGRLKRYGYDSRGNRWNVDPLRGLFGLAGNTPAIPLAALQWWMRNRVTHIVVHLTDGRKMVADCRRFFAGATQIAYAGCERQLVNQDAWETLTATVAA